MESMWRVNVSEVSAMDDDPYSSMTWMPVKTTGAGIGRISHHTACVVADAKALFYGGLQGEDSNDKIFALDLRKHTWSTVPLKVSKQKHNAQIT